MNREEASFILANIDRRVCDDELNDALDMAIKALEQEPCEDAIDRNIVCAFIGGLISDDGEREKGLEYIRNMPPVNPQEPKTETWSIKDVTDTFKKHGLIREQEPCEDAISRQAVQDYIAKYLSQYLYNDVREAVEVIDEYIGELPSVTPQPKTGHWIRQDNTKEPLYGWYFCSECNSVIGDKTKFCSNCGAKMVEPQESEDKE